MDDLCFDEQAMSETKNAWDRYLADTRGVADHRYEEVEPWAWAILRTHLAAVKSRLKVRIQAAA